MNKREIISLVLLLPSIAGLITAFQLEVGATRQVVGYLSIGLLIAAAMIPPKKEQRNRISQAIAYFFLALCALAAIAVVFYNPAAEDTLATKDKVAFYVLKVSFLMVVVSIVSTYFSAQGWLARRVKWATGQKRALQSINKVGNRKNRSFCFIDHKSETTYTYHCREKQFTVFRTMFTNPLRHGKEYGERKYQFVTRFEQSRLPVAMWISDEATSNISFQVAVMLQKPAATKDAILQIRDMMDHLAKEDYQQPLYARFFYGDDIVYLKTYHYHLERVALVRAGQTELHSYEDDNQADANTPFSKRLNELLEDICNNRRLDKLTAEEMVDADTFDRLCAGCESD